jgi:hypothetical protein
MCRRVLTLGAIVIALISGQVRAETADPLRAIPAGVDAVLKVESPSALYHAIYDHPATQDFLKIDAIAAIYDTTNIRRFLQVVAYLEKELGHQRLDLLDRLAGGGVAVAAQFDKKAVLVAVQAKDEELLKQFVALSLKVLDQELSRQGDAQKIQTRTHRGVSVWQLGEQFHAARQGAVWLMSNQRSLLETALDLSGSSNDSLPKTKSFADMKSRLPQQPLLWGALNLEHVKEFPNVKNALNSLALDPTTLFLVGGLVDIIKRSPYVCAGLARDGDNLQVRIAMPRGRDGMAPVAAMLLPGDERGSLPILAPPHVLTSTSYFLDLGKFWDDRHKILSPEQVKRMDQFEAQTSKYLRGLSLGAILRQAGKYHRIVTTIPDKFPYKIKPTVQTGAFGVVLDMRDPAFAKSLGTILRGAALVGGLKYGVKMVDEQHQGHTLVTYYFPENGKFEGDDNNIRFNFNPCFTQVGDQFVIASTLELGKDLIDCLVKENSQAASPATQRTRVYATGLADNLRAAEDLFVSQAILGQALPAAQAKQQFEELVHLVQRLGRVSLETYYRPDEFRFDVRWQYEMKANQKTFDARTP